MNYCFIGSLIVNVVPFPNALCTDIIPVCSSTIFLAIDNPRPYPDASVLVRDVLTL